MPDRSRLVIAVDFDGTVVDHCYPYVGKDVPLAVETLLKLQEAGCRIILWTMRSGVFLQDAIDWFVDKGISLYGIQKNPTQQEWTDSPKAYAHIYIDDAAYGCPLIDLPDFSRVCVDWKHISKNLL
jgi:hypothetical protein